MRSDLETTSKEAAVPIKLTLVVPTRLVPKIHGPLFPSQSQSASTNGAQTNGQTEERATIAAAGVVRICAATNGRPVESSISMLDQSSWECVIRLVEVMQHSQRAGWSAFEDRPAATSPGGATPAAARCPVEVPIAGLDQCCTGIGAIRVLEFVQCG